MFSLEDLGSLDYLLGLEVKRQQNGALLLTQGNYIHDLLAKTNLLEVKSASSPMFANHKLSTKGTDSF